MLFWDLRNSLFPDAKMRSRLLRLGKGCFAAQPVATQPVVSHRLVGQRSSLRYARSGPHQRAGLGIGFPEIIIGQMLFYPEKTKKAASLPFLRRSRIGALRNQKNPK
jgi:hypothetical protein